MEREEGRGMMGLEARDERHEWEERKISYYN